MISLHCIILLSSTPPLFCLFMGGELFFWSPKIMLPVPIRGSQISGLGFRGVFFRVISIRAIFFAPFHHAPAPYRGIMPPTDTRIFHFNIIHVFKFVYFIYYFLFYILYIFYIFYFYGPNVLWVCSAACQTSAPPARTDAQSNLSVTNQGCGNFFIFPFFFPFSFSFFFLFSLFGAF